MNGYLEARPNSRTVSITATSTEFLELAAALTAGNNVKFQLQKNPSPYYPMVLDHMVFEVKPSSDLLTVDVRDNDIAIVGGSIALRKLSQSLINVFTPPVNAGTHFHLDYFENNQLLEPTDIHLIFEVGAGGG